DPDSARLRRAQGPLPVRAEMSALEALSIPYPTAQRKPASGVPETRVAGIIPGQNHPPVSAELSVPNRSRMRHQFEQPPASRHIPHEGPPAVIPGQDALAVRTERCGQDLLLVTELADEMSRLCVPQHGRAVARSGEQQAFIMAENGGPDK